MSLGTFGAVLGFVFFVAPGVLWARLGDSQRAPRPESAFRESGSIALASAVFSALSTVLVLGGLWLVNAGMVRALDRWVCGRHTAADSVVLPVWTVAAELAVVLALVLLADRVLGARLFGSRGRGKRFEVVSGWVRSWEQVPLGLRDVRQIATVRLCDGTVLRGELVRISNTLDVDRRELILGAPIVRVTERTDGSEQRVRLPDTRVVIAGREVRALGLIYSERA
ncbi:DUF6338 family protein [Streptomyces sp. NPDC002088]|uniref:DUF6338 family protein n=1 Tax=Streptomyces sp. NPDC002088 TaxID=3154665 RepID=UPI00332C93EF